MTGRFTSLTATAIREIIAHRDHSLLVFDKYKGRMSVAELQVKSMLSALRKRMQEQPQRQSERESAG